MVTRSLFFSFHPFKTFLRWLFTAATKPSQRPYTPPTGRVRNFPGVVPLPGFQNRTRVLTGPSLVFLPKTSLPLPLKGEGLDIAFLWWFGFSLAVAFGNCWPQLGHTPPTGRVWGFGGVTSLPGSQNRTQGHTGPSLDFTVFSF